MASDWMTWAFAHWAPLITAAGVGALAALAAQRARHRAERRPAPRPAAKPKSGVEQRMADLAADNLELVRLFVMLPDLGRALSETTERGTILATLVEQTRGLLPEATTVAFFGPPPEPGMPLPLERSASALPAAQDLRGDVPLGKGLVGQAFVTGETLTDGRLRQRLSAFELEEVRANDPTPFNVWAAVPVSYDGEPLGVLAISHPGRAWATQHPDSPDPLKVLGIVSDVAAISLQYGRAMTTLADVNLQLQELDRLKSEFVSMVSHDLRTPLTSVSSALQNLADGVAGPLNVQQGEYLAMMRNETDRLVRLINALLDLQRIEAGGVELSRMRVHLRPLAERTLKVLRPALEEKGVQASLNDLPADLMAQGDPDRLSQVLFNLLDNATKFTAEGGKVAITGERRRDLVVVSVTNTGPVISDDQAAVVFERFRQLRTEGQQRPKGAGLGLAIAKRLVEMHGGQIWARGVPGTGTRFAFSLPTQETP